MNQIPTAADLLRARFNMLVMDNEKQKRLNAALLAAAKALRLVADDTATYRAWKIEFDALEAAIAAQEKEA